MSESVSAGVILTGAFVMPHAESFEGYIDYMSRSEVVRNEKFHRFNVFQDTSGMNAIDGANETMFDQYANYMSNPLKTKSLFNRNYDQLPIEVVDYLKNYFIEGQHNGSPLWQLVFSFRNDWLVAQGLMNEQTNEVSEEKIYDAARLAMTELISKENLQAEWLRSIHFNTRHIHVHIGMVEKNPTRERIYFEDKQNLENSGWQYKGKFKIRSMNAAKSKFVNHLLAMQEELALVDYEVRTFVRTSKEKMPELLQGIFQQKMMNLYQQLPKNRSRWKYGYAKGFQFKKDLDELISLYFNTYAKEELKKIVSMVQPISESYEKAYGNPKQKATYLENKLYGKKGLYAQLANVILHDLKEWDKTKSMSNPSFNFSVSDIQQLEREQECVSVQLPSADEIFESDHDKAYEYYLANLSDQEPPVEMEEDFSKEFQSIGDFTRLSIENPLLSTATEYLNEALKRIQENRPSIEEQIRNFEKSLEEKHEQKIARYKSQDLSEKKEEAFHSNIADPSTNKNRATLDHRTTGKDNGNRKVGKKEPILYEEGAKNISKFSKENQKEIAKQFPSATFILGPNQWRLSGRQIKESERNQPIMILAPVFFIKEGIKKIDHFIQVPFFDVTQTEKSMGAFIYTGQDGIELRPAFKKNSSFNYYANKDHEIEKLEKQIHRTMKNLEYSVQHYLNEKAFKEIQNEQEMIT